MAFVSSYAAGVSFPCGQRTLRSRCLRTRPRSRRLRVASPSMMAKYQERDTPDTPAESEGTVDKFIPPVQLPTLNTLAGEMASQDEAKSTNSEIDLTLLNSGDADDIAQQQDLAQMGISSLSKEEEFRVAEFLRGVYEEFLTIEWPGPVRVFRITIIVILSIILSAFAIYFVDGFFLSLSQYLFDLPAPPDM